MNKEFIHTLFQNHEKAQHRVQASAICQLMEGVMQLLFPTLAEQRFESEEALHLYVEGLQNKLSQIMMGMEKALPAPAQELATKVMQEMPFIHQLLLQDAYAIAEGDPAAQSLEEVIRTYPGFKAVAVHRVAHTLYNLQVPLLPRVLSEYAHAKTGIDIHPGAKIGTHFCIDHGTGVVIGETTVIGNHVKVYQGVTLGALSVDKAMAKIKRHPTIEDHVVIYAGATILGGNTVVGTRSVIGGNVWLTESVPAYSRVYHRPQIKVNQSAGPADAIDFSI
ncbi:serine O-acetyltransferase EpsC [Pontibacter sp. SGAir0037]|uniref:serine O-acetyltransferase EpsC n=1 Tax=Pontibacter sp. SGAir0037 TaxID=2571030 RepID=UPI0010CD063A|nr:serine O-acetyltransferase EpsC [Pontibacter sp. SGAir0037]QCR24742.1 serine acetyltransferase [Pontibacter sp. SGAir0037]